jgi:hypothetical protein
LSAYKDKPITNYFNSLIKGEIVVVGGRTSCGGKVDPTWVEFISWNEVVRKAIKLGYKISVESIKQANKSPTMAGGYWQENRYTLSE